MMKQYNMGIGFDHIPGILVDTDGSSLLTLSPFAEGVNAVPPLASAIRLATRLFSSSSVSSTSERTAKEKDE